MAAFGLHVAIPRALGGTLIAGALVAITLAHAQGQPRHVASTLAPHHTAVTIQRASAVAGGQIAQPAAPVRAVPLASNPQRHGVPGWHQGGEGEHHHHGHKSGGDG
jgi:hypothetical protein